MVEVLTRLIQVVPQDSAILPGYIPIGIHSNHRDMTKYEDAEDPGFVAICGELRRWVKEMNSMNSGGERRPLPGQQLVPESKEQPGATTIYGDHN